MTVEKPYREFLYDFHAIPATWEELDMAANRVRWESRIFRRIWAVRDYKPLDEKAINHLIQDELRITIVPNANGDASYYRKRILIGKFDNPFERDRAIFHELAHAWFGEELDDGSGLNDRERENRIIADWIARQARANPSTLRAAILGLNLEPRIYDKTSYQAFSLEPCIYKPQSADSSLIEFVPDLRKVLMD